MQSRPTVGILHRKKLSTDQLDRTSFSSLSLLPDEFNRSLSEVDTINTLKGDSYSLESLSNPDIEMGLQEANQPKLFLQTTGPRGRKVKSSEHDAVLVYNTTFGGQMVFPLEKKETTIGRKDNNDIVISDGKISKQHAIIIKNDNKFYIKDNNSSNGIRINGHHIEANVPLPINFNDEISIGNIDLKFLRNSQNLLRKTDSGDNNTELVTILPSEKQYEETVTIRAEEEADVDVDFKKVSDVSDIYTLKEDYEKLRLAYQLSKVTQGSDVNQLLAKSMDLIFEILPVDRGVVLLVDQNTGILATQYVKLREGRSNEGREILLSSTILRKVFYTRKCLITSDACEDPMLGKAASVRYGQIRSVICVPLISNRKVHGILHLDSRDKVSFSKKDLGLVRSIGNQTSIAIENNTLLKEVESKARITEQLSRFLAPHVVDRMTKRADLIGRGGRDIVGTIIFADIRGFTDFSERLGRVEVFNLLNDYFERLVRIVFKYNGVVDKFIGDALMAVFGSLEEEADSEFRAVAAALEFKNAIKEMNEERQRLGKESISIGVGLNTGELLVGFVGSSQRLEYTCIGDTVNTSSRICSKAKNDQVLFSESTYKAVKDRVHADPIGYQQFKGKKNEVMIYEAKYIY